MPETEGEPVAGRPPPSPSPEPEGKPTPAATPTSPRPTTQEPTGDATAPVEPTPTPDPTTAPADPLALDEGEAPEPPAEPAQLAELLLAAERAIRDAVKPPEELAQAGHWQQVLYRRLGEDPVLAEAVIPSLPADLQPAARANTFAAARLREMHTAGDPEGPVQVRELPAWRIVEPPPAEELRSHYAEAEAATGVHWSYLAAVNLVETRMGRIRGDSAAGAQGPMQFMPATWAEWGQGDVNDPRDAILAAARFLRWGGMPGDVDGALFRYNRDVRYVDAVRTYAEQMQADPRAFYGYYHWQVYYDTGAENVWLAAGYDGSDG